MNVLDAKRSGLPYAIVSDNRDRARASRGSNDRSIRKFQSSFYSHDRCFDDLFRAERNNLEMRVCLQ